MKKEEWNLEITASTRFLDIEWKELWQYKDLIYLFVKRDIVATYKQTILGPLWFFIQPILTTLTYTLIFGNIAGISTGGVPKLLFYLSGVTFWNYFQECVMKTSETFITNQNLFGKVYFPRLAVPLSIVLSNLIKFFIQFILFLVVWLYYFAGSHDIQPNSTLLFLPLYILIMSGLGLSFGVLISSLTTKYRDLRFLVQFGIQLAMFATPVVYPVTKVFEKLPAEYSWVAWINPMSSVIEGFRYSFTGHGVLSLPGLLYSFTFMVVGLVISILFFNKVEKTFMDTV